MVEWVSCVEQYWTQEPTEALGFVIDA
jgi:hypothetical protein